MVFWVLYSLAVLLCAGFFLWNLLRYALPQHFKRKPAVKIEPAIQVGLLPEIVALQAQFLVAPRLAILEAQKALEDREAVLQPAPQGDDLVDQFERLISTLSQRQAHKELREV
jgi:hypothetical protein